MKTMILAATMTAVALPAIPAAAQTQRQAVQQIPPNAAPTASAR